MISIIVAASENNVIGINNHLPWHLPADLQHFKRLTLGNAIIMGRKTFESIGKVLPGRQNIVITRSADFNPLNTEIAHSLKDAIEIAKTPEIFIIGGAHIYAHAIPIVDRIYLTRIHQQFAGDAFFPQLDEIEWEIYSQQDCLCDEHNPFNYSFIIFERKSACVV